MTLNEIQYDVQFKIDKVDSLSEKNFEVHELDWIINESIDVLVKQRYGYRSNNFQTGFEGIQKRIDDLKTLHVKSPTNTQPGVVPVQHLGGFYEVKISDFALPYWFMTRMTGKFLKDDCYKTFEIEPISTDKLTPALSDSYSGPSFKWGLALATYGRTDQNTDSEGSIYVYTNDEFELIELYPEYIKKPNVVWSGTYDSLDGNNVVGDPIVECDLPEMLHKEIANVAVEEISRIIEHPNFLQLKTLKLQKQE